MSPYESSKLPNIASALNLSKFDQSIFLYIFMVMSSKVNASFLLYIMCAISPKFYTGKIEGGILNKFFKNYSFAWFYFIS